MAAVAAGGGRPARSPPGTQALPLSLLTTTLWLSLWIALGSLSLALADGLGAHPSRRLAIGLLLVLGAAAALWKREVVCARLRVRPGLILPLAAAQLGAAAADGLLGGPYVAFSMTSIGVAVVVARPATVWRCVALLDSGYALVVFSGHSPASLWHHGDLAGVVGQLLGYPFAGLSLLALAALFKGFEYNATLIVDVIRGGAPALTPALARAIALRGQPVLALPAPAAPRVRLTPAEVAIVEGLARGLAPKQLAHRQMVSLATVRSHIKHAKRKTGSRTLRELSALAAHPDWPELTARVA